jgi:hypothetical protein
MMRQQQVAAIQSLPLETQQKLRRASWINFGASMTQVGRSLVAFAACEVVWPHAPASPSRASASRSP